MKTIMYNGNIFDVEAARNLMDDDLCDRIHGTVSTEQEFFDAYLIAHAETLQPIRRCIVNAMQRFSVASLDMTVR